MEASTLPTLAARRRPMLSAALLRLRSDDQLVALFRSGSEEAFGAIHDRYHPRLLAYARGMLRATPSEAEDAMQDVFVRAYRSMRASSRPISLRAWLYRIAHNRCLDELRRPNPTPTELDPSVSRPALVSPASAAEPGEVLEQRERLRRLLADVQRLPQQQRSALLLREVQGLSYQELADTLGMSVAAVKSLLLRARSGLVDFAVAREEACTEICVDLVRSCERGVRVSGRARRHLRECPSCRAYRRELRRVRSGLSALAPAPAAGLLGGSGLAASGGGALGSITAAKVAAVACCAALVGAGGGVAIQQVIAPPARSSHATPTVSTQTPASTTGGVSAPASTAGGSLAAGGAATAPQGLGTSSTSPRLRATNGLGGSSLASSTATAALTGASGVAGALGATGASGSTTAAAPIGSTGASGVIASQPPAAAVSAAPGDARGDVSAVAPALTALPTTSAPAAVTSDSAVTQTTGGATGNSGVVAAPLSTGATGATGTSGATVAPTTIPPRKVQLQPTGSTGATGANGTSASTAQGSGAAQGSTGATGGP